MRPHGTVMIKPRRGSQNPNAWAAQRRSFGALGIGVGTGTGNQAQKSLSLTSEGASIGATAGSIIPGIGTAIGAGIGAFVGAIGSLFGPAKEGQAAVTWDDMVSHGYILSQPGRAFDERYFGEALKGAMDKGSNIWPGCGASGYKNPDCFYSKVAAAVANGYLNHVVPLTATTDDVWTKVVVPWLSTGANGLFNWGAAVGEAQQQHLPYSQQELLIKAAVDRYINGLPITRANMPAYAGQGGAATYAAWSTPSITQALASLLTPPPVPAPPPAPKPMAQVATPAQPAGPKPAPPPAPTASSMFQCTDQYGMPSGAPVANRSLCPPIMPVAAPPAPQTQAQVQAVVQSQPIQQAVSPIYQPQPTIITVPGATQYAPAPVDTVAPVSSGMPSTTVLLIAGAAALFFIMQNKKNA